jgi:hypothetical protein
MPSYDIGPPPCQVNFYIYTSYQQLICLTLPALGANEGPILGSRTRMEVN